MISLGKEENNMEFSKKVRKSYFQELRKRHINLPSILLVFYAIPITMSVSIGQGIILKLFRNCPTAEPEKEPFFAQWLQNALIFCLHPLVGWLADTKIGRDRTISLSLWFSWVGTAIQTMSLCIEYDSCKPNWLNKIATYGLSLGALLFLIIGIACYQSIILAYGLDQLPDASTAQIRRFINWLTWAFFVGFFFNYLNIVKAVAIISSNLVLGMTLATFIILSIAVILHTHLKNKFYPSTTVKRNPYVTVMKVLKYIWKHKTPTGNRSAFTFWENKVPSRINFAKSKYGGPFPESDVEDTKTFWRVVAVFCSLGGLFIPYSTVVAQSAYYGFQFQGSEIFDGYGAYVLWQTFYQFGIVTIPLLDLIILPLFPKIEYFFINSLKGYAIAITSLACGLISMLVIEGIAVARTHTEIPCYLSMQDFSEIDNYLNLSYYFFIIPWLFIGTSAYFSLLKTFEFICSQAPNEMSGMLTGVFWLIRAVFISIGTPLTLLKVHYHELPCTFWIIIVQLGICIPFWLAFGFVSTWYQGRLREPEFPIHNITERHYSQFLHSSYVGGNTQNVFSKYDLPVNGWSDDTIPVYS